MKKDDSLVRKEILALVFLWMYMSYRHKCYFFVISKAWESKPIVNSLSLSPIKYTFPYLQYVKAVGLVVHKAVPFHPS